MILTLWSDHIGDHQSFFPGKKEVRKGLEYFLMVEHRYSRQRNSNFLKMIFQKFRVRLRFLPLEVKHQNIEDHNVQRCLFHNLERGNEGCTAWPIFPPTTQKLAVSRSSGAEYASFLKFIMNLVRLPCCLSWTSMYLLTTSEKPSVRVEEQPLFRYLKQLRFCLNYINNDCL